MILYPVMAGIIDAYNRFIEVAGEPPTKITLRGDTLLVLQAEFKMSAPPTRVHGMEVVDGSTLMPYTLLLQ